MKLEEEEQNKLDIKKQSDLEAKILSEKNGPILIDDNIIKLFNLVKRGKCDLFKIHMKNHPNLLQYVYDQQDTLGGNLLHVASTANQSLMIELLFNEYNADPTIPLNKSHNKMAYDLASEKKLVMYFDVFII